MRTPTHIQLKYIRVSKLLKIVQEHKMWERRR